MSTFPRIQEIVEAKEPYDKLWRSVVKFTLRQDEWLNGCFLDLNAEEIEEEVAIAFIKILYFCNFTCCSGQATL